MSQPTFKEAERSEQVVDRVLRVAAAHPMSTEKAVYRAIALAGETIVAVAMAPHGLDHLVSSGTRVLNAPDLTLLPAFNDSHEHLMEAAKTTALVSLEGVNSIAQLTRLIRRTAEAAPPGAWVQTSSSWHESDLAEDRLPTIEELDTASLGRPVYVRRGGHLAVASSEALRLGGVTSATANPPGGSYGRGPDGHLNGIVEGSAVYSILSHAPKPGTGDLAAGLQRASAAYAALGVGSIREALIEPDEWSAYTEAARSRSLSVRARPLVRIPDGRSAAEGLALLDDLASLDPYDDDWLRLWGLKIVFDGGVEGAALEQAYAGRPGYTGHVNWDADTMVAVATAAVNRGWRIGTHAVGDRAVRLVLDVYERVQSVVGGVPPGTLVLEHAMLAVPEQQARAVSLGIPVTVQHTLLWNMGSEMVTAWGRRRAALVNPLDQWLHAGADLAVGTDVNRPVNPMMNVWGMVTRATKTAGVIGPEHRIDRYTAVERYTAGTARLCGEADRRGTLEAGRLADIVAYRADPFAVDVEALPALEPVFTIIGGHPVYDPDGRLEP